MRNCHAERSERFASLRNRLFSANYAETLRSAQANGPRRGVTGVEIDFENTLLGRCVEPTGKLGVCRDPDDDIVLETALLGGAQFVVSRDGDIRGDADLVRHMAARGVQVVSVNQFLDHLQLQ